MEHLITFAAGMLAGVVAVVGLFGWATAAADHAADQPCPHGEDVGYRNIAVPSATPAATQIADNLAALDWRLARIEAMLERPLLPMPAAGNGWTEADTRGLLGLDHATGVVP